MSLEKQLTETLELVTQMKSNNSLSQRTEETILLLSKTIKEEKPILVCGNGGSASDAAHITGELVGRFLKERKAINAICLSSNLSAITAWANDYSYETIFARQVEAHGKNGGALLAISTSGNSKNIILAIEKAKELGIPIIGLTGLGGGKMKELCDILIDVPSTSTPRIQELHIMLYHYICERIEKDYQG
ncbi:MAG: SIS domain-containing protein [Leptospiraceae bacterium]|nr:SIS domain-containing protein [Leptospiraceae bacterium]